MKAADTHRARRSATAAGILGLLVLLSFGGSLFGEFVWDDGPLIIKNQQVKNGDFGNLLTSSFWESGDQHDRFRSFFRPVVLVSYALDYAVWGANPLGFHLTNLLLHFGCCWLVYRLALGEGLSEPCSVGGAGLFAVHPVHVESVAWISGRTDLLCALFFLASFLAYRRALKERGVRWWLAALSLFALALLSKEMAATLPVLVFFDGWRRNPENGPGARVRRAAVSSAPALAVLGGYLVVRGRVLGQAAEPLLQLDVVGQLATSLFVFARYVTLLILPVGLDAHYPYAPYRTLASPAVLLSAAMLLVLLVLLSGWTRAGSRRPTWILWILITLLPVLAFGRFGDVVMADRFLYLPSVGLAILAAAALDWLRSSGLMTGRSLGALSASILIALAFLSFDRSRVWHDDRALFTDMKTTSANSALVRCNLGKALYERGEFREAIEEFRAAILAEPGYAMAYNGLGSALQRQGDTRRALEHYAAALRLAPRMFEPSVNLGHLLVQVGQTESGLELLQEAVSQHPGAPEAVFALADALDGLGRSDRALQLLEQSRREHPDYARAHFLLGTILFERGQTDRAAESMRDFLGLWADDDELRRTALRIVGGESGRAGSIPLKSTYK